MCCVTATETTRSRTNRPTVSRPCTARRTRRAAIAERRGRRIDFCALRACFASLRFTYRVSHRVTRTNGLRDNGRARFTRIDSSFERRSRLFEKKKMAIIGRVSRAVSTVCRKFNSESRFRWSSDGKRIKAWFGFTAATIGSCGVVLYFLNESSVKAFGGIEIRPPKYPWAFNGTFKAFDHAALRRGWQVYRTVCHACHSLQFVRFLDLVNVTHTAEEVKQIAAEFQVEDGPDDQGNYYMRPAILSDAIPSPYPNEEAAKTANYGAVPPDLTYMILTRKRGLDYVFSLLTGWMDPPAGVTPDEGQYFNVYFTGGFTTMPRMFYEGIVEYDDGTPATDSQMAKDVVEFLMWTASSEHDTRKIMTLKCMGILLMLLVSVVHINRRNWSHLRSRRIAYVPNTITREPLHPTSPFADKYGRGSKRSGSLPN